MLPIASLGRPLLASGAGEFLFIVYAVVYDLPGPCCPPVLHLKEAVEVRVTEGLDSM